MNDDLVVASQAINIGPIFALCVLIDIVIGSEPDISHS
jgi:hypothetical protein